VGEPPAVVPACSAAAAARDPKAADFVADPRTGAMGGRALGEHPTDASEADYDAHRLSAGVPDPAADAGADRTYPIEANFDLLHGIDFGKGCFVGQETTSRMKRRGEIEKRMLALTFDGPPPVPGAEVLNGERRAGEAPGGEQQGLKVARKPADHRCASIAGRSSVNRPVDVSDSARAERSSGGGRIARSAGVSCATSSA
jgi:folate-binding protein YgfZ